VRALLKLIMRYRRQDQNCRRSCRNVTVCISVLAFGGVDHVAAFDTIIPTDVIFVSGASEGAKGVIIGDFPVEVDSGNSIFKNCFLLSSQGFYSPINIDWCSLLWSTSGQIRRRCCCYGDFWNIYIPHIDMRGERQKSRAREIDYLIGWRTSAVFGPQKDGYGLRRYGGGVIVGIVYNWVVRENIGTQLTLFGILSNTELLTQNGDLPPGEDGSRKRGKEGEDQYRIPEVVEPIAVFLGGAWAFRNWFLALVSTVVESQ